MEIKNKLTVNMGSEERENGGKKGNGQVKEHVLKTNGQGQLGVGIKCGRWGIGRAGESNEGKMRTTVIEQQ